MSMQVEKGFVVYKKGAGDVLIALHAGPQYGSTIGSFVTIPRDSGSDIVSSIAFENLSGSLVLSSIPRNPANGVDFNRTVPTEEEAMEFSRNPDSNMIDRYAWMAFSQEDYRKRMEIYRNFWSTIRSLGERFFLIHMVGLKMAYIPTAIDIITFDSRGIKKDKANEIAEMLTERFSRELELITDFYKKAIVTEYYMNFPKIFDNSHVQREWLEKDIEFLAKNGMEKEAGELTKGMDRNRLIDIVKKATDEIKLKFTVENTFSGKKAFGPKKELLGRGKMAVEIELSKILQHFPKISGEMLVELIKLA